MGAVRTRQFSGTNVAGTAPTNLYIVPVDRTALIKSTFITNTTGIARMLTIRINAVPFYRTTVAAGSATVLDAMWVGQPNDSLDAFWDLAVGTGVVSLFGSLLLGAPA